MLKMKSQCEKCQAVLEGDGIAFICSFECTFCERCASELGNTCPNCSGELLRRPRKCSLEIDTDQSAQWTAEVTAACHCGAVQIEVARKPETLTECNCSICRRYGAQWAYYDRSTARVTCAAAAVSAYTWNDREIEFYHCNRCGCMTHYESVEKADNSRIAVNTRMMPLSDVAAAPIRHFDGADTWKFLQE